MSPVPRPLWLANIAMLGALVVSKGHVLAVIAAVLTGSVVVAFAARGLIGANARLQAAPYLLGGLATIAFAILTTLVDITYGRH